MMPAQLQTNPIILEFACSFFVRLYYKRFIALQALAFRGRSLSLLGFLPAGSQVDTHFPQECRALRSIPLCIITK